MSRENRKSDINFGSHEPNTKHRKAKSGFTFVELMVVLALSGILGLILLSSFVSGMRVWKRAASANIHLRRAAVGLERLGADFRRAQLTAPAFIGNASSLEFLAFRRERLANISYSYVAEEKAVVRRSLSSLQMSGGEEEGLPHRQMTGVASFNVSYFGLSHESGNETFLESWNASQTGFLPQAIKVFVELEDGTRMERVAVSPSSPP